MSLARARSLNLNRGDHLAVALRDGIGYGIAASGGSSTGTDLGDLTEIERELAPRWVWWDRTTSDALVGASIDVSRCWDLLTVHRLQRGGWTDDITAMWIDRHDLNPDTVPTMGQMGLLDSADEGTDTHNPVRPDGYLRPEWVAGAWGNTLGHLQRWAELALDAAEHQRRELDGRVSAAHAESGADLLCAELARHGLPFDTSTATDIIERAAGPRPESDEHERRLRAERDAQVLAHVPPGPPVDLRNPAGVKAMLRRIELDLPDTRAWRLEQYVDHHPLVAALLTWRKAERLANTYGYRWLDEHVRDRRLRGQWGSTDGAAGRMTASSGLHNLPGELRPAVCADGDHLFIRADLGQVEPRVLAAVSGDPALVAATSSDDLYQPVADRLRVERDIAKVAVLGAMYGSTTGESANALRGLQREYPVAMSLLENAAEQGRRGESVATFGGRPIHMWDDGGNDGNLERAHRVAAARGRFARNAVIQGAAAEFFKVWALTVRARGRALNAEVVLCLHDELLVHVPADRADEAAAMVNGALDEAAYRWWPRRDVRFITDTSIVRRWSDAKG